MSQASQPVHDDAAHLLDQFAAEQHAGPVASIEELSGELWESDEELDEFLAFVRQERDADLA